MALLPRCQFPCYFVDGAADRACDDDWIDEVKYANDHDRGYGHADPHVVKYDDCGERCDDYVGKCGDYEVRYDDCVVRYGDCGAMYDDCAVRCDDYAVKCADCVVKCGDLGVDCDCDRATTACEACAGGDDVAAAQMFVDLVD